jgi:two-component sensor histidine kinase
MERREISVSINRQDNTLATPCADNGAGIPADFDLRNAKSLGLRLVVDLVEQISGMIELDQTTGTTFNIVVKEKA